MRNVMERVEAITKIESLVTRKYQQFLDWLGVPGDRHKPSEVARVVLDFCHDVTNVVEEIKKEKKDKQRRESMIVTQRPPTLPRMKKEMKVTGKDTQGPSIMSELQQKLNRRNTTDNVLIDDIDSRVKSNSRGKQNEDEEDEFLRVLRNDFQNRRLGVRRKGQSLR